MRALFPDPARTQGPAGEFDRLRLGVTLEVEGPSPMELAIKKINSYETVRNLQSYVKAKKALDWPGLFKPSEVEDLLRIADEKIAELEEAS